MSEAKLEAWLDETRSFPPTEEFAKQANAQPSIYADADADPLAYWRTQADRLSWTKEPTKILEWDLPFAKWFSDGTLNASYNCVDRHVEAGKGDKVAYHWVADAEGESRTITYGELQKMVAKAANGLSELGVKSGDRVAVYMPMIPEAIVTMLAIVRLGAMHSVIFAGFSADSLSSRILDSDCQVVVTADGAFRRGVASPLKPAVDEALKSCPNVRAVLVVQRTKGDVEWTEGRDHWWHDMVDKQNDTHAYESFEAEHSMFIMYTSGTTAKPKGIFHATGGYLTQAATTYYNIFDVKPDTDVCWTAADIGWITGHSYIVYGPLINGVTSVMYEGLPDSGRTRSLVEDHRREQSHDSLHRTDDHSHAHEVGTPAPRRSRPHELAPAGHGGRAHQPRSVDLVPRARGWRPLSDRGHVVADRDRGDHDLARCPASRRPSRARP
jgi:acetyl-CoA synthetase